MKMDRRSSKSIVPRLNRSWATEKKRSKGALTLASAVAAGVSLLSSLSSSSRAADLTWDGDTNFANGITPGGGTWTDANRWRSIGGNVTWSGTTDVALFGGSGGSGNVTINTPNGFTAAGIRFTGPDSVNYTLTGGGGSYTIGNSGIVVEAGAGSQTFAGGVGMNFSGTNIPITNNSANSLTLATGLQGSGSTNFNGSGIVQITNTNSNSSYTGPITVTSGTLRIAHPGTGSAIGTGTMTLAGGTLDFAGAGSEGGSATYGNIFAVTASSTINVNRGSAGGGFVYSFGGSNPLQVSNAPVLTITGGSNVTSGNMIARFAGGATLNSDVTFNVVNPTAGGTTTTLQFAAAVNQSGGTRSLTKNGNGTLMFRNGDSNYAGTTTINAGTLMVGQGGGSPENGRLTGTSGIIINDRAHLLVSKASSPRLPSNVPITFNGGQITFEWGNSDNNFNTFAGTVGGGLTTFRTQLAGGDNAQQLAMMSSLTRTSERGANLVLYDMNTFTGGVWNRFGFATGGAVPTTVGGGGGDNSTTKSIIPWMVGGRTNTGTGTGTDFVTTGFGDGYNFLRPLTFNGNNDEYANNITSGSTTNVRLNGTQTVAASTNTTINALNLSLGGVVAGTNSGSTLTVTSGGVILNGNAATVLSVATLAFGGAEGFLTNVNANTQTISSSITGTNGATFNFTNTGSTVLSGTSTYTGQTTINGIGGAARLVLAGGGGLNSATNLQLNKAVLQLGNASGAVNQTITGLATSATSTGNAIVGGNASVSTLTTNIASGTTTYTGLLGGGGANENNLALTKTGNGTLVLTSNNTYIGTTTVSGGTLRLGANATVGSSLYNINNGTFDVSPKSAFSTSGSQTLMGQGNFLAATSTTLGGTLTIGQSHDSGGSASTLTTTGSLNLAGSAARQFDLFSAGGSADQLAVSGSLNYGGSLSLANPTSFTYASGQSWTLFNVSGSKTGAFTNNGDFGQLGGGASLPTLPSANLYWDFNYGTGVLSILSSGSPNFIVPASASIGVLKGGTYSTTILTTNNGNIAGTFTASDGGSADISVSPTNGPSVNDGATSPITITATNTANFGTQNATVTVTPNDGTNHQTAVTVVVGDATAERAANDRITFGASLMGTISNGGSYAGLSSRALVDNGGAGSPTLGTVATILGGDSASSGTTVSMAWRTRNTNELPGSSASPPVQFAPTAGLASDVVDLEGIAHIDDGGTYHGSFETDKFVLQMTYDEAAIESILGMSEADAAAAGLIGLGYLDLGEDGVANTADDVWRLAVEGNFDPTTHLHGYASTFEGNVAWNASYLDLGDWGVDTENNVVWAVLNHNSQFAAIPEPSGMGLLGLAGVGLMGRWKRRNKRK